MGVPAAQVGDASARVVKAIDRTLNSEKGRWILADHAEAQSELALSGLLEGSLIHAVIDRTFVDEEGRRWVIDYKTSVPKNGESHDVFLRRETGHYRDQMRLYARLMRQMEPQRKVLAAFYFPLVDAWCPVEV